MTQRAELERRRALLTPAQREQLANRLRGTAPGPRRTDVVVRSELDGPAPLSFAQTRLWFMQELDRNNPFYNESVCVELLGPLRLDALQRSVVALTERHEALRTTFRADGAEPLQYVAPHVVTTVRVVAVEGNTREERLADMNRRAVANAREPVDLGTGPLFRIELFRLSAAEHVLHLRMHHIVADGWSIMLFVKEMGLLYEQEVTGRAADLPPLPLRYRDYAIWQRAWLTGPVLEKQLGYWKRQLQGVADLHLPSDRPRPAQPSYRGARAVLELSPELTAAVRRVAQQRGVTLFMLLFAAFQTLLHRLSRETDVAVGVPIANRHRPEIEPILGFFVNTLVLRADLANNPRFSELLAQVREVVLDAQQNQDVPFERVVEALQPDRASDRNPLFQVMFLLHDVLGQHTSSTGLRIVPRELDHLTAKFDLTLFMRDAQTQLSAMFEYSADLFEAASIARLLGQWQTLLWGIVREPEQRIGQFALVDDAERARLLALAGSASAPESSTFHERFSEQARKTPERVALVSGTQELCYGELEARSELLARRLVEAGVKPEATVALLVERGPDSVLALLAVLKAGAAYLPLDLRHPQRRLTAILAQAAPAAVIVSRGSVTPPWIAGLSVVVLGDQEPVDPSLPLPRVSPASAAYVLFTSGSTGTPKGVVVEHRQLTSYIAAVTRRLGLVSGVSGATVSTLAADLGHTALFPPLLLGGTVNVVPEELVADADRLADYFESHPVDYLKIVPAHLEAVLAAARPERLLPRQLLVLGGDAVSWDLLDRLRQIAPNLRVFNHYGPTETTVGVISGALEGTGEPRGARPALGKPLDGAAIYLLDAQQALTPFGVPGEVLIGGRQVARGYLSDPALTAERFVPDPFGEPGARIYRSGDLARHVSDGQLEFVGRVDNQVKIRGYRIELAEIRSLLLEQPFVREAYVMARQAQGRDKSIVAYVVQSLDAASASAPSEGEGEQVSSWRSVFEDLYEKSETQETDPTLNLTGWMSSYTGQLIESEEMKSSIDETVRLVKASQPKRILELGCGIGLLVHRLAPHCERFVGTDFSREALTYLSTTLKKVEPALDNVTLLERSAEQLDGLDGREFDLVLLNSVVQYFPSVNYLTSLLTRAVECVRDTGTIVIGDVRSLPLSPRFHESVELFRAPDTLRVDELRHRAQRRQAHEQELLLHPDYFNQLRRQIPALSDVRICPKRGRFRNELASYRYDVILHVRGPALAELRLAREPWGTRTLPELRAQLAARGGQGWLLCGVPNARLAQDCRARALLAELEGSTTVGELRRQLDQQGPTGAVEPEDLFQLGEELGYQVELDWAEHDGSGRFDVIFCAPGQPPCALHGLPDERSGRTLANSPLLGAMARRAMGELSPRLAERLPEYMIPSAIVVVDSLPLSENGKIDERRLPAPELGHEQRRGGMVLARDGVEELLLGLFAEVLGVEQLGINDDFFALGGHSLLATQLVARIRKLFAIDIPLRDLFEATTVVSIARVVRSAQRALLGDASAELSPQPVAESYPLSHAQLRFWFLDRLNPGNTAYNLYYYCRLRGPLDREALQRALNEIVRRHEVLRSRFLVTSGGPRQTVDPEPSLQLASVDLTRVAAGERERELRVLAEREVAKPFRLASERPLRVTLVALGTDQHALLVTVHHIASDAWSRAIMLRELSVLYQAFASGQRSPLPELSIQYRDFAVWQRDFLAGEPRRRQLEYWRQALHGASTVLDLPSDYSRPAVQGFAGASLPVRLTPQLTARLRRLARESGATLYMALLAGFGALLARYSGQSDVLIGSPIANRTRASLEPLIGFFANTLVMRVRTDGEPTVGELLERVKQMALGAYANQDLPFEELVADQKLPQDLARHPLFQVMFVYQNVPQSAAASAELSVEPLEFHSGRTMFDLTLVLGESRNAVEGVLEFNRSLFDEATVRRLVRHFSALLERAVEAPACPVSRLPLLGPEEEAGILRGWNDTERPGPLVAVHELVSQQARRSPDAIALECGNVRRSYRQLEARAERFAREVLSRVPAGAKVGILAPRTAATLEATLGILKAGCTCVPLDGSYPEARLLAMVDDAGVDLLVTSQAQRAALGARSLSRIVLGDEQDEPREQSVYDSSTQHALPLPTVPSELAAYVMFTSGSTGRPKGVELPHRALTNLVQWHLRTLLGGVRTLQFASLGFDASFHELFATWASGGTLVVASESLRRDIMGLARFLAEWRVAKAIFPVVVLHELASVALSHPSIPLLLREITATGEQLQITRTVSQWLERVGECTLHNHYGPSESHVVTAFTLSGPPSEWPSHPSIGTPIDNTQIYLLDAQQRPVPVGVLGELYIGGVMLAHGYAQRPELTAERFVPCPFGPPGARLYRSGDLARYRSDGCIEFVGRRDHQLKIRGFRVEPAEVEAGLEAHPAVAQAVVVPRRAAGGELQLIGYVVPAIREQCLPAALRAHLQTLLPEAMIPAALVVLTELPLTQNGKVDRAQLPEPSFATNAAERASVAPRDEEERAISQLIGDLLELPSVGVYDDFFAQLGGHSLSAVRLLLRIEQRFGVEIPLLSLFREPTVDALARQVRSALPASAERPARLVTLSTSPTATLPLILVHPLDGTVACYYDLAKELPERSLWAIEASSPAQSVSIPELAARYVELLRAEQPSGPYLLGGWSMGATLACEMSRQLNASGERVACVVNIDRSAHFQGDEATLLESALSGVVTDGGPALAAEHLRSLSPDQVSEAVVAFLRARGHAVQPAEVAYIERTLATAREHLGALERYQPARCPVHLILFRSAERGPTHDEALGWGPLAESIEVHASTGDHHAMIRAPHVVELARLLQTRLAAVEGKHDECDHPSP